MNWMDLQSASPSDCDRRARVCFLTGAAVAFTGALPIPFPDALDRMEWHPFLKVHFQARGPLSFERLEQMSFLRNSL
jgi:hypothetical protein